MKPIFLTTLVAGMLAVSVSATGTLLCTLTGKTIESCCCTTAQNGKLHCTLANKDIEQCCCKGMKHK